jgi:CRP/FNR family cyclic AMP-dependent transcriptional regulator
MSQVPDEFRQINLLQDLPAEQLERLQHRSNVKVYPRGTLIVNYGDDSTSLYLILEGRVRVFVESEEGDEAILAMLGPGESFGELALFSGKPRTANVMTVERSKLAVIGHDAFMAWLGDNPDAAFNVIRSLVERHRMMTEHISSLALLDVYGRVRKLLEDRAVDDGSGRRTTDRLTHQDIAGLISASREMVTRILNDLRTGGYISIEKKRITLEKKLPPGW